MVGAGVVTGEVAPHLSWAYTFGEKGADFQASYHGEIVGRLYLDAISRPQAWFWAIHCARFCTHVPKERFAITGRETTKAKAVQAVKDAWAKEWVWRVALQRLTAKTHGCWPVLVLEDAWRHPVGG